MAALIALAVLAAQIFTLWRLHKMTTALEDLTAEVAQDTTVIESAVTLIDGFAAQLAAAGTDPAKLAELTASLASERTKLADAVAANTPAAPPTV